MSKIRHYRELAGMTQGELAAAAGLGTSAAISNYEAGRRAPDVSTLVAIRDALSEKLKKQRVKVSLEDLIDQQPAA